MSDETAAEPTSQEPAADAPPEADAPGADAPGAETPTEGQPAAPARFERQVLEQRQLIKRLESENRRMSARFKELEGAAGKHQDVLTRLKDDPLSVLQEHGYTYDDLTKRVLENTQLSPEEQERLQLKQQIEALQSERDQERQAREEREQQQQFQQLVSNVQEALGARADLAYLGALDFGAESFVKSCQDFQSTRGYEPTEEEQEAIASDLNKRAQHMLSSQVERLAKASPDFRAFVMKLVGEVSKEDTDQSAETVETEEPKPRRARAPRTINHAQQTSVESRVSTQVDSRQARKDRALERLKGLRTSR